MSAIIASSMPQPTAAPLTAAITGTLVLQDRVGRRGQPRRDLDRLGLGLAAAHHGAHVVAGAERRVGAGDHQAARRGRAHRGLEHVVGLEAQRVAHLRPVDGDDVDVAVALHEQLAGVPLPLSCVLISCLPRSFAGHSTKVRAADPLVRRIRPRRDFGVLLDTWPVSPADDRRLRAGVLVGIAAYILWGLLTIYWHELVHFDAFELIGYRVIFSALTMAIALTVAGRWRHIGPVLRDRALLGRVALTAVLLTVNWTSYVYAVVHDRVLETALGYFIAPVGTMLVGAFVLHERLRRAQVVAIGFAVAAIVVLTVSYGRVPYLALAIAVSWTAYGYLKKQVPLDPLDGMAAEVFLLARRRR